VTKPIPEIDRELEARIEALAMELVDVEWAGSGRRPVIRIRVDFPDSKPGQGVTVDDCARVSRELESWLDAHEALSERYVLEVSSPGVERPLKRRRDFDRFAGEEVLLKGEGPLAGTGSRKIQGILRGTEDLENGFRILVETRKGTTHGVSMQEGLRANLVFRWEEEGE
jgi:ribosome maturation factor RimP